MLKKGHVKALTFCFYALIIFFIALSFTKLDWTTLSAIDISVQFLALSCLAALLFRFWGSFVWLSLLKDLGAKLQPSDYIPLVYIYSKAWLGRYIPGTAPWILGKVLFAARFGVSKNKLAVSSLLEGILQISVTLVISSIILLLDQRFNSLQTVNIKNLLFVTVLACTIVIIPPVFNRIISIIYKIIKKKGFPREHFASKRTILRGVILYTIGSFLGGISFYFLVKSIYPLVGVDEVLFIIGASNLASSLSMLAIFTPSGLGVREGFQVLFLSQIMPTSIAILIAAITRIWSILLDLVFFGTGTALNHKKGVKKLLKE